MNLLWQSSSDIGQIFIVVNGQIIKSNLVIWSNCVQHQKMTKAAKLVHNVKKDICWSETSKRSDLKKEHLLNDAEARSKKGVALLVLQSRVLWSLKASPIYTQIEAAEVNCGLCIVSTTSSSSCVRWFWCSIGLFHPFYFLLVRHVLTSVTRWIIYLKYLAIHSNENLPNTK